MDEDFDFSNYDSPQMSYDPNWQPTSSMINVEPSDYDYSKMTSTAGSPTGDWYGENSNWDTNQLPEYGQNTGAAFGPQIPQTLGSGTFGLFDNNPMPITGPTAPNGFSAGGGGISDVLQKLFSNPNMLLKGLGALFEGSQNKKYASNLNSMSNKLRQFSDPFASQRGQYQQRLSETYTDPNVVLNRPEIRAQLEQMRTQLDRRDAANGRRNQYGDREVQLQLQAAQLVDNYRKQLAQLAGGNLSPQTGGLAQMFQQGAQADANGYVSPILNAASNITQQQQLDKLLNALRS